MCEQLVSLLLLALCLLLSFSFTSAQTTVAGGTSCSGTGIQVGYNINRQDIVKAEQEDQRGEDSCEWESPPENGFNFRLCSERMCSEEAGSHKRNGTLRFTRCDPHYVLVGGCDRDTCVNGQWTSSGHQCIPCGRSQNTSNPFVDLPLIHKGQTSSLGDFPWMAALYFPLDGTNWEQICGGTLISPNLVLTAAHCLAIAGINMRAENLQVGLGKLFSSYNQTETSSVISTVEEIVRHGGYGGVEQLYENDIALLVLSQNVTGAYIMPVCVDWGATMEPVQDEVGYLAGWGKTALDETASPVLLWATQKYVQYDTCQALLSPENKKFVTKNKFCAAQVEGGQADKGDSGGGFTMLRGGVAHYVYGVLSTKLPAGIEGVRTFTKVLSVGNLNWLKQQWRRILIYTNPLKNRPLAETENLIATSTTEKIQCELSETVFNKGTRACAGQVLAENFDFNTVQKIGGDSEDLFTVFSTDAVEWLGEQYMSVEPLLLEDKYDANFTKYGILTLPSCTSQDDSLCSATADGNMILPPVLSGRLTTEDSFSFRYGTIEVTAKLPSGDWVVPELWLMPKYKKPGVKSGRIILAMSRGNAQLTDGKQNFNRNVLEAGVQVGSYRRMFRREQDKPWSDDFHQFRLVWTPDDLTFYVDDDVIGTLHPACVCNSSDNTTKPPFYNEFYLVYGVHVGGVQELEFPDALIGKPWVNTDPKNKVNFLNDKNKWRETWNYDTALHIRDIKVTAL